MMDDVCVIERVILNIQQLIDDVSEHETLI
jgi:hypothetical protein